MFRDDEYEYEYEEDNEEQNAEQATKLDRLQNVPLLPGESYGSYKYNIRYADFLSVSEAMTNTENCKYNIYILY